MSFFIDKEIIFWRFVIHYGKYHNGEKALKIKRIIDNSTFARSVKLLAEIGCGQSKKLYTD